MAVRSSSSGGTLSKMGGLAVRMPMALVATSKGILECWVLAVRRMAGGTWTVQFWERTRPMRAIISSLGAHAWMRFSAYLERSSGPSFSRSMAPPITRRVYMPIMRKSRQYRLIVYHPGGYVKGGLGADRYVGVDRLLGRGACGYQ